MFSRDLPGVRLVIVGHLGFSEDRTPHGVTASPGGAGYACARGASAIDPGRVGLVAAVGKDYDLAQVRALGTDLQGVHIRDGDTPRFAMVQHPDGRRTPRVELGAASTAAVECFPTAYHIARHVHIATAPPAQQLAWLRFLRALPARPTVSVDTFETYARLHTDLARSACQAADLAFMNEDERRLLFAGGLPPEPPVVTKLGPVGASYHSAAGAWPVATEPVADPVDTTGAGEILASVFLALRAVGRAPRPALRDAVRAATTKVTEFGVDGPRLRRVLAEIRAGSAC